jgi:hypothetical protein
MNDNRRQIGRQQKARNAIKQRFSAHVFAVVGTVGAVGAVGALVGAGAEIPPGALVAEVCAAASLVIRDR